MLKTKVLAADIANLTDARYFAAWGVDYMSFCMGEGSDTYIAPPQVKEIIGWIAGPTPLLQFKSSQQDEAYISWMMESCEVDGILIGGSVDTRMALTSEPILALKEVASDQDMKDLAGIGGIIITNKEVEWEGYAGEVFLDYVLSVDEIKQLLDSDRLPGLVLRGGAEQKVGIKEYDDLDEIIEVLEED
jgi:phosphoribosylanthranilate isomerase